MSEFKHYSNHQSNARHADNCGACALENPVMIDGKMGINYAGWPLSYMNRGRIIPTKFFPYLADELSRTDNIPYLNNLKAQLAEHGYDIKQIKEVLGLLHLERSGDKVGALSLRAALRVAGGWVHGRNPDAPAATRPTAGGMNQDALVERALDFLEKPSVAGANAAVRAATGGREAARN